MNKAKWITDRHGNRRRVDAGYILQDGERMSVSGHFMDGAPASPVGSDADAKIAACDAYEDYRYRLQHGDNAVRPKAPLGLADAQAAAATARVVFIEQLGNAWRRQAA